MGAPLSQAGPSNHPQGLQCPPGHGEGKMVGTATFLQGLFTWVREPDGSWSAEPSFYQKCPSPHCLPFLEIPPLVFAIPLLRICCFGGHFNHCCPRPHHRGHGVPHRQAPPTGTGMQSLSEQVNHSPTGDRSNLAGQFPLKTSPKSFCLLIQMFMEDIILGPRTFSGSPLLTGF